MQDTLNARLIDALTPYLGPHTARVAVKTFAERALGAGTTQVSTVQLPALLDAMRPMLRTLLGADRAMLLLGLMRMEMLSDKPLDGVR